MRIGHLVILLIGFLPLPSQKVSFADPPNIPARIKTVDPTKDLDVISQTNLGKFSHKRHNVRVAGEQEQKDFISDLYGRKKYEDFAKVIFLLNKEAKEAKDLDLRKRLRDFLKTIPDDFLVRVLDMEKISEEHKEVIREILFDKYVLNDNFSGKKNKNIKYAVLVSAFKGLTDLSREMMKKFADEIKKEFEEESKQFRHELIDQFVLEIEDSLDSKMVEKLVSLNLVTPKILWKVISKQVDMNPETLETLVGSENPYIRSLTLDYKQIPRHLVAELLKEKDSTFKREALDAAQKRNFHIPDSLIQKLIDDPAESVRWRLPDYPGIKEKKNLKNPS